MLLLALLLVQIRNFYGLYAVLVAGVGVFAVSWWGSEPVQSAAAYAGTWFLLLAAPRPVLELQRQRRRGRARDSDADLLARLTPLPGLAWVGIFLPPRRELSPAAVAPRSASPRSESASVRRARVAA